MRLKEYIGETMGKSTSYAVTGSDKKVIAKGSKKEMVKLKKKMMKEKPDEKWMIWLTPGSKIGDIMS